MNTTKYTFSFLILFLLTSCTNFLEVEPQDKILENKTYSTEFGIQNVHNGIYIQLAADELYGRQLTMDAIEILGQQYNIPSSHSRNRVAIYAYEQDLPKAIFSGVWVKAYTTILNINKFLENIEKYKGALSNDKIELLKGEVIAIRAMLHFDMLRLFGPIYSVDSSKPAIPYYNAPVTTNNPLLPAKDVLQKILEDIDFALPLLRKDPVQTYGKQTASGGYDQNPYYTTNRGLRMNYFAAKCLKARVLLYSGDKLAAYTCAKEIIEFTKTTAFFPWTPFLTATNSANPDRIFSSENFFALSDFTLYNKQQALFDSNLEDAQIYSPLLSRLTTVFESNDNDYRSIPCWKVPSVGGKTQKTFFKYEDVVDKTKDFRFQIPMFKLAEIYLIAAETSSDPSESLALLNTLRFNRGLANLAPTAVLTTELTKEYRREFIGEGQLFFYYKRNNINSIPNGSAASGNLSMGPLQYVIPLPDVELNFQN